ncbi:PREDICTED: uncharacterized protein LOC109172612 isoform X2 [Ipomoea nil]|uniref:uncharacterized protein LOC109172612 isoform X2 n=1 Tax=Ipomoea nil TaxID=35883 RepID=UPI000901908D|nr:PREDICTED: uncharacterized protein LOC109172612 isoform X2 [Ipomoea nil]
MKSSWNIQEPGIQLYGFCGVRSLCSNCHMNRAFPGCLLRGKYFFSIIIKHRRTLKLLQEVRMILLSLKIRCCCKGVHTTSHKVTRCYCTASSWRSSRAALRSVKWVLLSCLKKQGVDCASGLRYHTIIAIADKQELCALKCLVVQHFCLLFCLTDQVLAGL